MGDRMPKLQPTGRPLHVSTDAGVRTLTMDRFPSVVASALVPVAGRRLGSGAIHETSVRVAWEPAKAHAGSKQRGRALEMER